MKVEHKAVRLYPTGFSGDSLGELNESLNEGWLVKIVIPEPGDEKKGERHKNVLILEREIKEVTS